MKAHPSLARTIGNRLELLLEKRPCSQRDLAKATGITFSALNNAIKGESVPSADALIRLSLYYGVSIDWLVGESESPTTRKRPKTLA